MFVLISTDGREVAEAPTYLDACYAARILVEEGEGVLRIIEDTDPRITLATTALDPHGAFMLLGWTWTRMRTHRPG